MVVPRVVGHAIDTLLHLPHDRLAYLTGTSRSRLASSTQKRQLPSELLLSDQVWIRRI